MYTSDIASEGLKLEIAKRIVNAVKDGNEKANRIGFKLDNVFMTIKDSEVSEVSVYLKEIE